MTVLEGNIFLLYSILSLKLVRLTYIHFLDQSSYNNLFRILPFQELQLRDLRVPADDGGGVCLGSAHLRWVLRGDDIIGDRVARRSAEVRDFIIMFNWFNGSAG